MSYTSKEDTKMNRLGKLLALSAIGFMSLGTTLEAQDVDPVGVYGITIDIPEAGFQLPGTMTIENLPRCHLRDPPTCLISRSKGM